MLVESVGLRAERVVVPVRVHVGANIPESDKFDIGFRINTARLQGTKTMRVKITAPKEGGAETGGGEDPGHEPGGGENPGDGPGGGEEPGHGAGDGERPGGPSDPASEPGSQVGPVLGAAKSPQKTAADDEHGSGDSGTPGALATTGTGAGTAWALGIGVTSALLGGVAGIASGARRRRRSR